MKRIIEIDQNLSLKAIVESDAIRMFNIINSQREYLGEWLPFVQFTNKVEDSKGFVEMAMLSRKLKKDYVYKICFDDRMIGLIGTKETDLLNKNTEIGYWLSQEDRKSTRLNSSHVKISYAVFCLKNKKKDEYKW